MIDINGVRHECGRFGSEAVRSNFDALVVVVEQVEGVDRELKTITLAKMCIRDRSLPAVYYAKLAEGYRARRDHLIPALEGAGFKCFRPRGAYYVMTDISTFGFDDDVSFTKYLVKDVGVAAVPGSSFYRDPRDGARQLSLIHIS